MRYIMPMMPFYLYFMYQGVAHMAACGLARSRKWGVICGVMLAASLLAESSYIAFVNLQNDRRITGPYDADSTEMFRFVTSHTARDARLMFFKPRAMRLLTGRVAFASNRPEDLAKADYLVIQKMFDCCNQISQPASEAMECVFENNGFVVYRKH